MNISMEIRLEEDRHWWFASRTRAILTFLTQFVGPSAAGERLILDVGGGAGNMAHHLQHFGRYIGVDLYARPLRVARQRGLTGVQGDAVRLPFATAAFDLIALLDTVEHIADDHAVLAECYRVLRDQGILVVTVPAFMFLWSYNDELNRHQRRYTRGELISKLAKHGFHVLRSSYTNFFIFPLALATVVTRRGEPPPHLASLYFDDDAYQVDMEPVPAPVNAILTQVGRVEAALLRHFSFPWGTGIIAIARKERARTQSDR